MALTPGSKILISDLNLMPRSFASTAARDAAITSPTAGMKCVIGSGATMVEWRYDGAAWWPWTAGWISYVPVLANLTKGAGGTVSAAYLREGRKVLARGAFVFGSGSAMGTAPTFSLPAPVLATGFGVCSILDSGSRYWVAITQALTGSNVASFAVANPSADFIGSTYPMTWASGDVLSWEVAYETAQASL